jgi:hypothetical protein
MNLHKLRVAYLGHTVPHMLHELTQILRAWYLETTKIEVNSKLRLALLLILTQKPLLRHAIATCVFGVCS